MNQQQKRSLVFAGRIFSMLAHTSLNISDNNPRQLRGRLNAMSYIIDKIVSYEYNNLMTEIAHDVSDPYYTFENQVETYLALEHDMAARIAGIKSPSDNPQKGAHVLYLNKEEALGAYEQFGMVLSAIRGDRAYYTLAKEALNEP